MSEVTLHSDGSRGCDDPCVTSDVRDLFVNFTESVSLKLSRKTTITSRLATTKHRWEVATKNGYILLDHLNAEKKLSAGTPCASLTIASAPFRMSKLAMRSKLFLDAQCNGVLPSESGADTGAPLLIKNSLHCKKPPN